MHIVDNLDTIMQNRKTKQTQKHKKTTKLYYYFPHSALSVFKLQPLPSSSAQVSAFGGEAGFSSCSYPEHDRNEQTKKQEVRKEQN